MPGFCRHRENVCRQKYWALRANLPAGRVILSRRRRISVCVDSASFVNKYRSAGKKEPALRDSCPPSFCYWSDKGAIAFSAFQNKIFEGGCKNGVLMQYKCMEKEVRKLHGRILFPSVMYIANIPAGMQLWQIGSHESLYTGSRFLSPISRGPGKSERILQIRKKLHNQSKTRIPSLAA